MPRPPEIGNVQLYPQRPLRKSDNNGYFLRFYCPIQRKRIRRFCGTRDQREARRVQKECITRLLNGEYVASGGAITRAKEDASPLAVASLVNVTSETEMTWDDAAGKYRNRQTRRRRRKSSQDSDSRIDIAGRIFEAGRANLGLPPGVPLAQCTTLDAMEYLQDQLLDGAEGRYDFRSPNTVNSMMAAILAFIRYCHDHGWIDQVPRIQKIEVDDVMRGRPITGEEFERMLAATPKIVGDGPAESWQLAQRILWESGFRVSDVMNFAWDDERKIRPVWSSRKGRLPTIVLPAIQKNRKVEEIPMLPGLQEILDPIPETERNGFVVNPLPIEYEFKSQTNWFMPTTTDLETLIGQYSNVSIAKACGVTETTVRKWLCELVIHRHDKITRYGEAVPKEISEPMKKRAQKRKYQRSASRLSHQRVSEIISAIGKEAGVVVRQPDGETGQRIKFASAHDLRRSLAERLINAGVSAETLMVVMRHKDFATTKKFYGATRAAQSAATEIHRKLNADSDEFVGQ